MSEVTCQILTSENIDEVTISTKEYENILNIQQEILSLIMQEAPSQNILNKLCTMAEALLPNAVASLMLKNPDTGLLYVKAAPTVPHAGWEALNGIKPGPHSGSCGNAIFNAQPQYIVNTFEDERGTEFLDTAKAFNLCSCWSMPIKNEADFTIGSFALSSFEHRSPSSFHKKLLEIASAISTIVLKNEAHQIKMFKMTYEDTLTTLKNKVALEEALQTQTFRTLILLNLNNFSYVNTAYGFDIGDKILIQVAIILTELFANSAYRINADEFALTFEEEINIEESVNTIREYFEHHTIDINDVKLKLSFTYGAAYAEKNLLKHAALALKKSKELGKNRLYIFNNQKDSSQKREDFIHMNTMLYEAFEKNKLVPYFQGIYNNTTNTITKYEALVRIICNDGTTFSPIEFLEVAKLSGLLSKITEVMIDKTFQMMSKNNYNFSINITESDLSSQYLVKFLTQKSSQYAIDPDRVTLEILEGISATGQKNNIEQLEELKRHGYRLAIDDFGAEYSNFERVLSLDIDFLKIDARYIKNIDTDTKSYEIVKAIVMFTKNMNIPTIAEFVHSASVQKVVEDLGIDYSQGYYFSEPKATLIE